MDSMNNLSELRQQIATALTSIEGLNVSAYRPSPMLPTPCIFIVPNNILYGYTIPRLNQKSYFDAQLLISRAKDFSESQSNIDDYLSVEGTMSISQAINNGIYTNISHVHCETMTRYGQFEYDGTPYFGALFYIETF